MAYLEGIIGNGSNVLPCVVNGHDFILRGGEVMTNLWQINYKFCNIEYVR
jgi:hypothetical protein